MRQATSMPMTSASSSARPEAPRCSANAKMADATGAAGWMMVFRWVSSKSKGWGVGDVEPLGGPEQGGLRCRIEHLQGRQRSVGGRVARGADGAAEPVVEGAHGFAFHRVVPATARMGADEARQDGGDGRRVGVGGDMGVACQDGSQAWWMEIRSAAA